MIVIADTSPINYLIVIDEIDILPTLFNEVIIPQAVFEELSHEKAPTIVNDFIANKPDWLKVEAAEFSADPTLARLGKGERQAIILAESLNADYLVIDERAGFAEAMRRNLRAIGTLFILELAAKDNLLELRASVEKLLKTSFRVSPNIVKAILDRNP